MNIGEERRTIIVQPIENPVPQRERRPAPARRTAPKRKTAPTRTPSRKREKVRP